MEFGCGGIGDFVRVLFIVVDISYSCMRIVGYYAWALCGLIVGYNLVLVI